MTAGFVIAGTSTGVGKTVFAAALTGALGAAYWKPVQAGLDGETDSATVTRLAALPRERVLPEGYRLALPASPHLSAGHDGVEISADKLALPVSSRPLVVETAGGVLVPLTMQLLQIEMIARWGLPVIVVASTQLGTINHSLLTLEALRARGLAVHGIAFVGEAADAVEQTIVEIGRVRRLGRLPRLDPPTPPALAQAFAAGFQIEDFRP
jgi:dethiobiotin synthetase